jgi:competence protein ComEC
MLKWSPFPVVRIAMAFIAGILLAFQIGDNLHLPGWVYVLVAGVFGMLWFQAHQRRSALFFTLTGLAGLLCFILAGYRATQLRPEKNIPSHLTRKTGKISHYVGYIDDFLVEKKAFHQVTLRIQKIKLDGKWETATGLVQLTIRKQQVRVKPEYGQVLLVKGTPQEVQKPLNPGQFDFRKYQAARNIYHQQFLNGYQYKVIGQRVSNPAIALSIRARDKMEAIFRELVPSKRESGIASALVLGVKDELNNDIKATYSNTGTMHVLAVSGLHVGLVFGLLNLGLKRLRNTRANRLLSAILLLSLIWSFAFITALSASVLRAAVMFTFIVFAQLLQKRSNIYNTLAAAALVLLMIEPFYLLDVGFQLSFVAVLAIVYLQPKIYRLWAFENFWLDKIWVLVAVSLAAQVGTIALSLFYFHQFPVYFLLTNLIAVPLSTGILYIGLAVLLFSPIPYLNVLLGEVMETMLYLMNESMRWLEKWPGALVNRIPFSGFQAVLIYLCILLVCVFLANRKLKYLSAATVVLGLVMVFHMQAAFAATAQKKLILFAVPKHTVFAIFENRTALLLSDSAFIRNKQAITFNLEPAFLQNQADQQQFFELNQPNKLVRQINGITVLVWQGISMVFLGQPLRRDLSEPVSVDYLVLRQNAWVSAEKLSRNFNVKHVILDASNAAWYRKWITPKLQAAGYDVYDVAEKGAFILVRE